MGSEANRFSTLKVDVPPDDPTRLSDTQDTRAVPDDIRDDSWIPTVPNSPVDASPPRKGLQRKLGDTEFKDTPRVERVWTQRKELHNRTMGARAPSPSPATHRVQATPMGQFKWPEDNNMLHRRRSDDVLGTVADVGVVTGTPDKTLIGAPGQAAHATALNILAEVAASGHQTEPGGRAGQDATRDQATGATFAERAEAGSDHTGTAASTQTTGVEAEMTASGGNGAAAAPERAGPKTFLPGLPTPAPTSHTPPLPPSAGTLLLYDASASAQRTAQAMREMVAAHPGHFGSYRAHDPPPTQGRETTRPPGGFITTDDQAGRDAGRAGGTAPDYGDPMMVDVPGDQEGTHQPLAQYGLPHRAISISSTRPTPQYRGTAEVKLEQVDFEIIGVARTPPPPVDLGEAPAIEIYNPAPANEADRAAAARHGACFANTAIKMSALGRARPCTDGAVAGARATNLNPRTLAKWKERRASGEPGVGVQVYSVNGDVDIAAISPARLHIEVSEALQLLFPDESPRVAPALGVHGGPRMPPGAFNVDRIREATAATMRDIEFMVVGRICFIVFDWEHGNSDFMGTFGEAVFEAEQLEAGLKSACLLSAEVRAVFRTLESRFPGYGAGGLQRFADSIKAEPLTMTARGASWIDYDELNVYGKTAGLIPPGEDGKPAELPDDLLAALRAAFATLHVDDDDIGRAVIRPAHHCAVCASTSHPTGKCPALTLEGWPQPAQQIDARRGRGVASPPAAPFAQMNFATRALPRGRGGGVGRGGPPGRGVGQYRGFRGRGGGNLYG